MNQPPIPDRKRTALIFVQSKPNVFGDDFHSWLSYNFEVWLAFEREANKVWSRGSRHYSARTIGEYLRHETATREQTNWLQFKLNNNTFPDLARLYSMFYPDRKGFFEFRYSPLSDRAVA